MSSEDIDKLFREGTQEHFPYDEALWQKAEAGLPPKEKERRGFYWPPVAALLLLVGVVSWLSYPFSPENEQRYEPRTANLKRQETPSLDRSSTLNRKVDESHLSTRKTKSQAPNEEQIAVDRKLNQMHSESTENRTAEKEAIQLNEQSKSSEPVASEITAGSIVPINSAGVSDPAYKAERPFGKTSLKEAYSFVGLMELMQPFGLDTAEFSMEVVKGKPLNKFPRSKKQPLLLEFQYNNSWQVENRDETEGSTHSRQFALLGLKESKHLHFGGGIRYARIRDRRRVQLNDERIRQTISFDTNIVVVNASYTQNGVPVWLVREEISSITTEEQISTSESVIVESNLSLFQIPVFLGYQYHWRRLQISTRGSAVANYAYRSRGSYFDESSQKVVQLEEENQPNAIFLNLEADLRLGYQLNEFTKVGAGLRYQHEIGKLENFNGARYDGSFVGIWIQHQIK